MLDQVLPEHLTKEMLHWNLPTLGLNVLYCVTIQKILRAIFFLLVRKLLHKVPRHETVLLKIHFFQRHL